MVTPASLTVCPACPCPDAERLAGRDALLSEVEALWAFRLRRLRPAVPIAGLVDRLVFTQPPPHAVLRCRACGTLRREPAERGIREVYARDALCASALPRLSRLGRAALAARVRRLTTLFGRPGAGLEVGPYAGGFLAAAEAGGWRFEGIDVNPRVVRFLRARGLRAGCGSLEDVPARARFDVIAIWNCFEQLEDPCAVVRLARERLRPGGLLALRTPNGAFYAALRPRLTGRAAPLVRALLAHSNLLGFPYRHAFCIDALTGLLRAHGFRIARTLGDALVPLADEWTPAWAAAEERVLRLAMRAAIGLAALAGGGTAPAPWLEVYARAEAA
jgi:SAM-dependent methyltransferase